MKTKRFAALLLALLLTMTASGSLAESIFDVVLEEDTEKNRLLAPSYGAMANVEPDQVEESAEGGTIVTYQNVKADGFNQFGEYLGRLGFSVADQETRDSRMAFSLSDGQVNFVMIYDQKTKMMQLIYPEGTDYAAALFPGYTRIEFNEEIKIPGLGNFTFHDFVLDDVGSYSAFYTSYSSSSNQKIRSWLSFTYYNTSTKSTYFCYYERDRKLRNDLLTATLVYQNSDDQYEYRQSQYGRFNPSLKALATAYPKSSYGLAFWNESCLPLSTMEDAVAFATAAGIRSSTDGTIAIKLDFTTGEKYVLVARENGVDLNIAAAQTGK